MEQQEKYKESQALLNAWQRQAELSLNADLTSKANTTMSAAVIALNVLAVFVSVLFEYFRDSLDIASYDSLLVILLIIPIVSSATLAFANKFQLGEKWLSLRSGAEEIRKDVFLYRTILQEHSDREQWLNERVSTILRNLHESVSGDLVLAPYKGIVPPSLRYGKDSDPGTNDLLAKDYLKHRLENQLNWHQGKVAKLNRTRTRFQISAYFFSALGVLFAYLGSWQSDLPIWVAVTSAIAAALTSWMELRRMETVVQNYSKVVLELGIIRDHWYSLDGKHRTGDQFFKMVMAVETVLWTQHNKYISEMRQAVAEMGGEKIDLVTVVLNAPVPNKIEERLTIENLDPETRRKLEEKIKTAGEALKEEPSPKKAIKEAAAEVKDETIDKLVEAHEQAQKEKETPKKMLNYREKASRPHAFVIMPFGRKKGLDGNWVDFNAIYAELIKPALEDAGFESFRADEETVSGDILTDMFQELLLADLCIVDMSIDNANVFYELGIRHAFRKRGLVHIQSGRAYMPFDVFNVRTIPYHTGSNGRPDPKELEKDIQTISRVAQDTWASDRDIVHSPVYNLLTGLKEPDRKQLRTNAARGFWREYDDWKERLEIAKRSKRIGDILLLTEEIGNPLIKEEAITEAGRALRSMGRNHLAIQQYQRGQEINPENPTFRREEAFHLNRIDRTDEAIIKLENFIADHPKDSEAIAYLGRIYREMWSDSWQHIKTKRSRIKEAYNSSHWLVKAIQTYLRGYRVDQNNTYPGINALTWSVILDDLAAKSDEDDNPDVTWVRRMLPQLRGAVQFALETKTGRGTPGYWDLVSLAELLVSTSDDHSEITRAYRKALTASKKNTFYLESSLGQLDVLDSLGFRPECVDIGREILQGEYDRITSEHSHEGEKEEKDDHHAADTEELVFLFSGHMIDDPNGEIEIFPPEMEDEARAKIAEAMDKWEADANDLGITVGAAAGGDILFIEECLRRNMDVEVLLPYDEPRYIRTLISVISEDWVTRFYEIRSNPHVNIRFQPEHLGPVKQGDNKYMRNNRWGMYSALVRGTDKVRFLAMWDGLDEEDSGDTYSAIIATMMEDVREIGAITEHIDTTKFSYFDEKMIRESGVYEPVKPESSPEESTVRMPGESKKDS